MNNLTNNLFIFYIVIVIFSAIYYFFGTTLLRPFRSKKMNTLAEELGLNYTKSESKTMKEKLFSYTKKKNILMGKIREKDILIYDFDTVTDFGINNNQPPTFYGNDPKKLTYINGKYYKDYFLPYISVDKIRKFVKEEISLKEYCISYFNKGIFIIIIIFGIFIGWIVHNSLLGSLPAIILTLLVYVINVAFIILAYLLAKKTKYVIPIKGDKE